MFPVINTLHARCTLRVAQDNDFLRLADVMSSKAPIGFFGLHEEFGRSFDIIQTMASWMPWGLTVTGPRGYAILMWPTVFFPQ